MRLTPSMAVAQLMPSLIAKVSASAGVMFMAACSELKASVWLCHPWATEIAWCSFLTLVSVTMRIVWVCPAAACMRLFSFEIWFLLAVSSVRLTGKKDMQLGKRSIMWKPGLSSGFKVLKAGWTWLRQCLMSWMGLLSLRFCLAIRQAVAIGWGSAPFEWCLSKSALRACCLGRDSTLSWDHLSSFLRCRGIGMRPAIASMPYVGEVAKGTSNSEGCPPLHFLEVL